VFKNNILFQFTVFTTSFASRNFYLSKK